MLEEEIRLRQSIHTQAQSTQSALQWNGLKHFKAFCPHFIGPTAQ